MNVSKTGPLSLSGKMAASAKEAAQRATFSEHYRRNVSPVYYYLYSRVRNIADAEDLTSQTFVAALESFHKLRDLDRFRPWVFQIARNKAADYFRRAGSRAIMAYDEALDQTHQARLSPLDLGQLIDLEQLISVLSAEEQEYLRLRLVADLPFAEIAAILRKNEAGVKKTYYRLLERLQAQAEQDNE